MAKVLERAHTAPRLARQNLPIMNRLFKACKQVPVDIATCWGVHATQPQSEGNAKAAAAFLRIDVQGGSKEPFWGTALEPFAGLRCTAALPLAAVSLTVLVTWPYSGAAAGDLLLGEPPVVQGLFELPAPPCVLHYKCICQFLTPQELMSDRPACLGSRMQRLHLSDVCMIWQASFPMPPCAKVMKNGISLASDLGRTIAGPTLSHQHADYYLKDLQHKSIEPCQCAWGN